MKKYFINIDCHNGVINKFVYATVDADLSNESLSDIALRVVEKTLGDQVDCSKLTINVTAFNNVEI